jgi:hypothetical protein
VTVTSGTAAGGGGGGKYYCPFLNKCLFIHEVDGKKFEFSKRDVRHIKAARKLKLYGPFFSYSFQCVCVCVKLILTVDPVH